ATNLNAIANSVARGIRDFFVVNRIGHTESRRCSAERMWTQEVDWIGSAQASGELDKKRPRHIVGASKIDEIASESLHAGNLQVLFLSDLTHFLERPSFQLADPLFRDAEPVADLLQGERSGSFAQAVTMDDDVLLARLQLVEDPHDHRVLPVIG